MAKNIIVGLAGRRLEVRPSPTSPGCVLVQIVLANREVLGSVTLDMHCAAAAGNALQLEATLLDAVAFYQANPLPVLDGVPS